MDTLTVAAVSGMKARLESLSLLANNIANSGSPGFKGDSEYYSLYTSDLATTGEEPLIERHWTDFSQGTPVATGNPTDLALRGQGFFAVTGPSGETLLTRNGSFRISEAGRLVTTEGYGVQGEDRNPLAGLDARGTVDVAANGELRQAGRVMGRIALLQPDDPASLVKRGALYFQPAQPGATLSRAPADVLQGRLESANVAAPAAAVRLIDVLRQFETLQKAIQINSDMGKGLDEIARLGN
jgi:flagellar basal-body rod protein FlgF